MIRESLDSSKKSSDVRRCYVCVVRHNAVLTSPLKKFEFSSNGLNERVLEQSGDGTLEKYRRVLNEKVNVTSNNRGFRTNIHSVATYEKIKKGLSYLYPKRIVETDEIHTQPFNLKDIPSFFFLQSRIFIQLQTILTFLTLIQSFYIAVSHISNRTRRGK